MSIAINPYVGCSGELLFIMATLADGSVCAYPTAVGGTLAVQVNGVTASMGPAVWANTTFQCPYITYLFPSPVLSTDSVTYTLTAGAITTASGNSPAVSSFTAVPNYVGQDEPGFGGHSSFTPNRVMPIGVDLGELGFTSACNISQARNARLKTGYVSGSTIVFDSTDPTLPLSWTPGGTINFALFTPGGSNGINNLGFPAPIGQYSIVFDDLNANNANALQARIVSLPNAGVPFGLATGVDINSPGDGLTPTNLSGTATVNNSVNPATVTLSVAQMIVVGQRLSFSTDTSGQVYTALTGGTSVTSFTVTPNYGGTNSTSATVTNQPFGTYSRTVVGNTVTVTYNLGYGINGVPTDPNPVYGYNMNLYVYLKSPTGHFYDNGTISNFWIFTPGDEANDRSDPLAPSGILKNWMTAPNGRGPASIRMLGQLGGQFTIANWQEPADLLLDDQWSWGNLAPRSIPIVAARFWNTNSANDNAVGNGSYPWAATPFFYHPLLGNQTDGSGAKYIDLSSATGAGGAVGAQDCGQILSLETVSAGFGNYNAYGALEFRTSSPHLLRGGDIIRYTTGAATNLVGTATVNNSVSPGTVTFSHSQTLTTGQPLTFSSDSSGQVYQIVTGGTGTSFSITPNYGGTNSTTATATNPLRGVQNIPLSGGGLGLSGTATVTASSSAVTFSVSQTLYTGQPLTFSKDSSGQIYSVNSGGTGTSFNITPNFGGTSSSSSTVIWPANILGTVNLTNGSATIVFSTSQKLAAGLSLVFSTDNCTAIYQIVTAGAGTSFTITPSYAGPSNASATANMPLPGTATVLQGSSTIVFSSTQSLIRNQPLLISSDSSYQAYEITAAGTGTTFTISPPFNGTNSSSAVVTPTGCLQLFGLSSLAWPTGPDTFAITCTSNPGVALGILNQTVPTTNEIPISISTQPWYTPGGSTYSFYAKLAAQWPGTMLWVPIMPHMSVACLNYVADLIAAQLPANSIVITEPGTEVWNSTFDTGNYATIYGRAMQYLPALTPVGPGTGSNPYYMTPTSPTILPIYSGYTLLCANQHDVLQARFDTWNKGITVYRYFGSQWGGPGNASSLINFACGTLGSPSTGGLQRNIPMSGIGIAPYLGTLAGGGGQTPFGSDTTWKTAVNTTLWPLGAIHDFYKHWLKYSTTITSDFTQPQTVLATYTGPAAIGQVNVNPITGKGIPALVGYECAIDHIDPASADALEHDLWYHPLMAKTINAYLQRIQDGAMPASGAGFSFGSLMYIGCLWGGGGAYQVLWSHIILGPAGSRHRSRQLI